MKMRRMAAVLFAFAAVVSLARGEQLIQTNANFEGCTDEFNWTGTAWNNWGEAWNQSWAAHSGNRGMYFRTWTGNNGGIWQEVASTATGTYTLSAWVRLETGVKIATNLFHVKMEFYAADHGTRVQADQIGDFKALPADGLWHHVYVSGVATSLNLAYVRPVIAAEWQPPSNGGGALMVDDLELYRSAYSNNVVTLLNPSFEEGQNFVNWRGRSWSAESEDHWGQSDWSAHSGGTGTYVAGWDQWGDVVTNLSVVTTNWYGFSNLVQIISQPVTPGTGTYTLSFWMSRENNFDLSNAELRIEWYDSTCSNKVQASDVTNFVVPNDNIWHQYYVQGTCSDPSLYEVRPVIQLRWNTMAGGNAARIDDVRFRRGTHDGYSVLTDWGYHSAPTYNALQETVPATNDAGTFAMFNYNTKTNTLYVLADTNLAKYTSEGDGGAVGVRVTFQRPDTGDWDERYVPMARIGSVTVPSTEPFHGLPAAGSRDMDLYRYEGSQPTNTSGAYYTNSVRVYYAPYFRATNGFITYDNKYLLLLGGDRTNNLGQPMGPEFANSDYFYDNYKPATWASLSNADFEAGTVDSLDQSKWFGWGGASRAAFGARSGTYGGFFPSWGAGAGAVYQDISTTGTLQFSTWLMIQPGANPNSARLSMMWFNKSGSLVHQNTKQLLPWRKENDWSHVFINSTCESNNLDYVRVMFDATYSGGTQAFNEGILFDDAAWATPATNLQNTGFETGFLRDVRSWYFSPAWIGMTHEWADRTGGGTNGFAFHGWENGDPEYEGTLTQPLLAATGTYVFSAWILREPNFINLTNAQLIIEWFDNSWSNKVQADTLVTLTVPNDDTWHQYAITGSCALANLRGIQPKLFAQWAQNPVAAGRAMKVDDLSITYSPAIGASGFTDGIPDAWWERYQIAVGGRTATNDPDADTGSNLDEYIADTDPTNNLSRFSNVVSNMDGRSVMTLQAGPPTTNSRVYDVWWKTNLMEDSDWTPYQWNIQGDAGGGSVQFSVTNDAGKRFYRTGVKLP